MAPAAQELQWHRKVFFTDTVRKDASLTFSSVINIAADDNSQQKINLETIDFSLFDWRMFRLVNTVIFEALQEHRPSTT